MSERAIELELGRAQVAFSTRRGGVSESPYESLNLGFLTDDAPERVRRNRDLLAEDVGVEAGRVAMGLQVHGSELAVWEQPPRSQAYADPGGQELARVDGHLTECTGLALLVLVADCLPVALAGDDRIAMLHCGWRGLAEGIVGRALASFATPPVAAVGPGIAGCCYEVGDEVRAAFADVPDATDGRLLDLRAVAEARLRAGGVERIEHVDLCTSCREDLFFSHRRDAGVTGRQGGMIWRTP